MMLENSFSATETTDGSDDNDYLDKNETISPQKPRKLRMMERTKKSWHHRSANPVESKKASVSVQLEEVDKIIELLEYRSILEEKEDCSGGVDMDPVASTSKDSTILPQVITKEKKYRRIRLFDGSSSSSSDTDADKNESSGPKERPVQTIVDDDSPQHQGPANVVRANSVSSESSKDLGHHSYKRSKSHNDKAPPYHHGKHSSSGSSHHHKKHSIIDESHHARSSKTRIEDAADVFPIIKK